MNFMYPPGQDGGLGLFSTGKWHGSSKNNVNIYLLGCRVSLYLGLRTPAQPLTLDPEAPALGPHIWAPRELPCPS